MFLPLGDMPNPRITPWLTYSLLGINVAVYLLVSVPLSLQAPARDHPAWPGYVEMLEQQSDGPFQIREALRQVTAYDLFVFTHGFRPARPQLTDLMLCMFLHGSFLHLAGNMLFLWIFGDNVEHRLGVGAYLLAYLGTGVAATLVHAAFQASSLVPTLGASGAISGVLGLYWVWFPRNKVRVAVFLFVFLFDVFLIPARWVLGFYLIVENLLPFILGGGSGGVAYGAHIGGFVAGALLAGAVDRWDLGGERRRARPRGTVAAALDPAQVRARIARGEWAEAAAGYLQLPRAVAARAIAPEEALGIGEWLAATGRPQAAMGVFRRYIADHPRGPLLARAHLGAGLTALYGLGRGATAYQYLTTVLDLDPDVGEEQRARQALADIQRGQGSRPAPSAVCAGGRSARAVQ